MTEPLPRGGPSATAGTATAGTATAGTAAPVAAPTVPASRAVGGTRRAKTARPRRLRSAAWAMAWLLLAAAVTVVAHVVEATRAGLYVATLGETRLAVAAAVARGSEVVPDPMPLSDHFAALQIALVQTVLPLADVPVVDAARWACLAFGTVAALLMWPVLRGLGIAAPIAAVGVVVLGAAPPAVALHAGISAGVPAATWLTLAVALAVRKQMRAAVVVAVIAVLTAPIAGAALLAIAAHVVLDRTVRPPARLRLPIGIGLAAAAVVVAWLAVGSGPLAGISGPDVGIVAAVIGVAAGLGVIGLGLGAALWLRPVLATGAFLLLVGLVPGPSRATVALLVAPVLAVAVAVFVEKLGERPRVPVVPVAVLLLAAAIIPIPIALATPVPLRDAALVSWLRTEPRPDVPIRADALDRAELIAAGMPAARLRGPADAATPDELTLVSDRPLGSGPAVCATGATLAAADRGTGGAAAVVCLADSSIPTAADRAGERAARTRLGSALAGNPALRLEPRAATALRDGSVDPRLMLVLAAMTAAHEIAVSEFPMVELDTVDTPRRQAVLTDVDGVPPTDPAASELLETWLLGQQPPFVPSVVRTLGTDVLIGFPVPPPNGLLPE